MKYVFNVCDGTGHTPHAFSEDQKAEAAAKFAELLGGGHFAYANKGGGTQSQLKSFDPTVEETTFHKQLQGG